MEGSVGAGKNILSFASKWHLEMLILVPVINYFCTCALSNSYSNKKTYYVTSRLIYQHEEAVFEDWVSKPQFKIEYFCHIEDF